MDTVYLHSPWRKPVVMAVGRATLLLRFADAHRPLGQHLFKIRTPLPAKLLGELNRLVIGKPCAVIRNGRCRGQPTVDTRRLQRPVEVLSLPARQAAHNLPDLISQGPVGNSVSSHASIHGYERAQIKTRHVSITARAEVPVNKARQIVSGRNPPGQPTGDGIMYARLASN